MESIIKHLSNDAEFHQIFHLAFDFMFNDVQCRGDQTIQYSLKVPSNNFVQCVLGGWSWLGRSINIFIANKTMADLSVQCKRRVIAALAILESAEKRRFTDRPI